MLRRVANGTLVLYCFFSPSAFFIKNRGDKGPQGPREEKRNEDRLGSACGIEFTSGEVRESVSNRDPEPNHCEQGDPHGRNSISGATHHP